jgi:hypothetical protein
MTIFHVVLCEELPVHVLVCIHYCWLHVVVAHSGIGDLGEFLASTFGAVGLGLPLILYHVEVVPVAGALLAFFGGILIFGVIGFDFWLERREGESEAAF